MWLWTIHLTSPHLTGGDSGAHFKVLQRGLREEIHQSPLERGLAYGRCSINISFCYSKDKLLDQWTSVMVDDSQPGHLTPSRTDLPQGFQSSPREEIPRPRVSVWRSPHGQGASVLTPLTRQYTCSFLFSRRC